MKRKIIPLTGFILANLFLPGRNLAGQTQDQMVTMVKSMIRQFEDFRSETVSPDEVLEDGAPFSPEVKLSDDDIFADALKDPQGFFQLSDYQNGYALVGDDEYPTNSVDLVFSYYSLPAFQVLNAWYELKSIQDAKGKNLLMSDKAIEKYIEKGIIGDEFNYPVPGEFSLKQWLNRELEFNEELTISGTIWLEYPSGSQSIFFTGEDVGISKEIGQTRMTLLAMEQNMVTLAIQGNRRKIEGLKMMILNPDGKLFSSTSSIAIDRDMYNEGTHSVKDLSDEEIRASVENFNLSSMETDQVKKIRVNGTVGSLVFLAIDSYNTLEVPFRFTLNFNGY